MHKFRMSPFFFDAAVFQYDDLIRIANGVQSMSDDKDGFTLHKRIQGGVDFPFVVGIE